MADYRAIAFDAATPRIDTEIADTDTLNVGNIAPTAGRLTLGGSPAQTDVYIANGHDFQVWGVGAELRTDGGADLIVGGSGSLQVPAVGAHRIYGGSLSIEVATNLSAMLTLVNGQTITTTNNGDITLDPHGTGVVNIGSNFYATGFDLGDPANRAGTLYANTLDATNIVGSLASCGTSCNAWEVNNDATGGAAENTGIVFPAGDGVNVQNFQLWNNSGAPEMILRYKQNPTDPADFSEPGYLNIVTFATTRVVFGINVDANLGLDVSGGALTADANGIDCAGNIDLNNTLSFDGVGIIDTSGDNNLTVDTGTGNFLVTANEVNLRTNVSAVDLPAGTGFMLGGVALTTALWTAPGVDTVFGGPASNADSYHTHSTIIGDGTNSNVWQINEDVAGAVAEQAGTVWLAADGVDVRGWRHRAATTGVLYLEHKTNPVDPADLSEAWTSFLEYDPSVNELRSNGNLIFPNGGFVATTNNGSFTVNCNGTGNFAVNSNNWDVSLLGNVTTIGTSYNFTTNGIVEAQAGRLVLRASTFVQGDAPLVDLSTSVTTLDVPDGVGFSIGGTPLTTGNWTAPNVDTLLDGSNADALHVHGDVGGVHIYPPAAVNPTVPAPSDGDMYFNTTLESWQYYDSSRSKWLSVTEYPFFFGEDSTDGSMLRGCGIVTPATGTGILIPRDATIKRITARSIAGDATKQFNILVNGVTTSSFALVANLYKNNAANLDVGEDDYVWVESSAAGTPASDVAIVFWLSWRS